MSLLSSAHCTSFFCCLGFPRLLLRFIRWDTHTHTKGMPRICGSWPPPPIKGSFRSAFRIRENACFIVVPILPSGQRTGQKRDSFPVSEWCPYFFFFFVTRLEIKEEITFHRPFLDRGDAPLTQKVKKWESSEVDPPYLFLCFSFDAS